MTTLLFVNDGPYGNRKLFEDDAEGLEQAKRFARNAFRRGDTGFDFIAVQRIRAGKSMHDGEIVWTTEEDRE
jgi:hypothetical protein